MSLYEVFFCLTSVKKLFAPQDSSMLSISSSSNLLPTHLFTSSFLSGELKVSLRCSLREEKRCWCWCRWWRRRPPGCRHCSSSCSWSLPASFAISRVIWTMHDARGRGDDDEGLPDGGHPPCSHSYGSLVAHHCWSSNIQRHLTTCIWVQLCCWILIVLEENGSCCWEGCRKSWLQQIWWMITGEWGETFNDLTSI